MTGGVELQAEDLARTKGRKQWGKQAGLEPTGCIEKGQDLQQTPLTTYPMHPRLCFSYYTFRKLWRNISMQKCYSCLVIVVSWCGYSCRIFSVSLNAFLLVGVIARLLFAKCIIFCCHCAGSCHRRSDRLVHICNCCGSRVVQEWRLAGVALTS